MSGIGAHYTFLPFFRRGLSTYLVAAPGSNPSQSIPLRAGLNVQLSLTATDSSGNQSGTGSAQQTVQLYGPGDVVGFNADHVVKTEPSNLTVNFEPDYFAGIEFDQPDFPWLFSPMPSPDSGTSQQLLPWIVLVVLADGERTETSTGQPLPYIDVPDTSVLPLLVESWCWAHVQITGPVPDSASFANTLSTSPQQFLSRLLCPRHLSPNVHYAAYVVPAFDAGVATGLGQAPGSATTLSAAWTGSGSVRLPYYYRFEFHTSDSGDFESLVRMIHPQPSPASVGTRKMSVTGASTGWLVSDPSMQAMDVGGALQSDLTVPAWNDGASFQSQLGSLLTATAGYVPQTTPSGDPQIGPPFYGRWHTGVRSIGPSDYGWLEEVNLDPRNRAVAGYGVWVVLKNRNQLMCSAWQQLQYVEKANQALRAIQTARGAMRELYQNNLVAADAATLVAWTQPVQSRVLGNGQTVASTIASSALPWRLLTGAGRQTLRPYGPVRHHGVTSGSPYTIYNGLADGTIQSVPSNQPAGAISYTGELNTVCPTTTPAWLWWVLLLLALVILVLVFVLAGPVAAAIALAIIVAVLRWLWPRIGISQQCSQLNNSVSPSNLSSSTFTNAPPQPNFGVVQYGTPPTVWTGTLGAAGTDSQAASNFRTAAGAVFSLIDSTQTQTASPPSTISLSDVQASLLSALNPETTLVERAKMLVHLDQSLGWPQADMDPLEPVMAYPTFPQPMYKPLRDWSQEILMPGVSAIPANSMTILQENHRFIEAYMLGLNVEMGRQLLWNGFPTDQRGSYFRQFWDISAVYPQPATAIQRETLYDIPPIDQWPLGNDLGANVNAGQPATIVLLLRGELLKRYPNTHIYACPASLSNGQYALVNDPTQFVLPTYRGTLDPDVTFLGFNLTEDEALNGGSQNEGYFLVFEQVPGELRFGLEPVSAAESSITSWAQLSWGNLPPSGGAVPYASPSQAPTVSPSGSDAAYQWNASADAAQIAYITFRQPARVAVLAKTMLQQKPGWLVPTFA